MPYSPGQYTTFADAQTAASSGDTIYVHGSSINYGSVTISKSLVIIGTGHNPDKQMPLVSMFQDILVTTNNVQLQGLKFHYLTSSSSFGTIKKCRIEYTSSISALEFMSNPKGWLIEGNVFMVYNAIAISFGSSSGDGCIIQNNIFSSFNNSVLVSNLLNSSSHRTYFLNNVVVGSKSESFANVNYMDINNNIFYGSSPGTGALNSNANNNITYDCPDNGFYSPGINNLTNVDPMFTSVTPGNFSYSMDFHLAAGSPGKDNGTDGTDRGVYGGLGNKFTMTGEPSIAEITSFTITSPTTIAPGGTLTISVTSKRVN
jgi:hypothetical protein